MIWATVAEVRDHLNLPADVTDTEVQRLIDTASRTLETKIIRWPVLNDTERAEDEQQRAHLVAAVAETIRARRDNDAAVAQLGGSGVAAVIAAGGTITASKLTVSGGSRRGGSGVAVGASAPRVPIEAYEALQAAGLIGGSVPSW